MPQFAYNASWYISYYGEQWKEVNFQDTLKQIAFVTSTENLALVPSISIYSLDHQGHVITSDTNLAF